MKTINKKMYTIQSFKWLFFLSEVTGNWKCSTIVLKTKSKKNISVRKNDLLKKWYKVIDYTF